MNKTAVACAAILAVGGIVFVFLERSGSRYTTTNAGEGRVYITDHKTGRTVLISGTTATEITPPPPPAPQPPPAEQAIRAAQHGMTFDASGIYDNEVMIKAMVQKMNGNLKIIGWRATCLDDQTYEVTYSFDNGSGIRSYAFEVNLKANIVRNIIGDSELERKYGFGTPKKGPWSDAEIGLPALPPGFVWDSVAPPVAELSDTPPVAPRPPNFVAPPKDGGFGDLPTTNLPQLPHLK